MKTISCWWQGNKKTKAMREREKGEWREEGHLGGWEGGSYSPVLTEYQIHKDFSPNRT